MALSIKDFRSLGHPQLDCEKILGLSKPCIGITGVSHHALSSSLLDGGCFSSRPQHDDIGTRIHPCPRVEEYLQKSNVLLDLVFWNNANQEIEGSTLNSAHSLRLGSGHLP